MRTLLLWIAMLAVPAAAALPPGTTEKHLPDNVTLYEHAASAQSLPSFGTRSSICSARSRI